MLVTTLETSVHCLRFTDKGTDTEKVSKSERRGRGYSKREKVLGICLRVQHRAPERGDLSSEPGEEKEQTPGCPPRDGSSHPMSS